ncbi:exported hypothetical protein [Vibrio chagasii]|nr:exported hypothetical protein [Vibrio chagasii]CAH7152050.1 exported hypothetical protein [Vibrio chagasii]
MRAILGILFTCLASMHVQAQTAFLDIEYSSSIIRPDKQGFLSSLLKKESNHIAMIVTVLMDNGDNNYTIVKPAKHVATFKIKDKNLEEFYETNTPLVKRLPVYGHEDILFKIEFFSLSEDKLTSLTEGIRSLGELYTSASSPQLSPLVTSVMDGFLQFVTSENNIYVDTKIKVQSEKSGSYSFYVDKNGTQTKQRKEAIAILNFDVTSSSNYNVNWEAHWSKQPLRTDSENTLFQQLIDANSHEAKKKVCKKLEAKLEERLPQSASQDMLAIAINSAKWPQDDTIPNRCMTIERAKDYKKKHPSLKYIVACNSEECLKSKQALNRWVGGSSSRVINRTLGVDITTISNCYSNIRTLNSWNSPVYSIHEGLFSVNTSVINQDGNKTVYKQEFLWEEGILVEHNCN